MVLKTIAITGCVLFAATAALAETQAAKDQSRLPLEGFAVAQSTTPPAPAAAEPTVGDPPAVAPLPVDPAAPPAPEPPPAVDGVDPPVVEGSDPPVVGGDEAPAPDDELSLGEIPVLETIELTPDLAKRAIDAYALVKDKYKDADLESYETLQDFVDQAADGKAFDADVKTFGFKTVNEWNVVITSISIAYTALADDPTADIKAQIEEIKIDTELAQDMKDRMVASLAATIPSENNLKIVRELNADAAYAAKLKLLEIESEGE